MKKLNLFIARTALATWFLSILSIIANAMLSFSSWGMNEYAWKLSWNIFAISLLIFFFILECGLTKEYERTSSSERSKF